MKSLLTPQESGKLVRAVRTGMWQWTQETLAEFSGVSLSVVERVERGVKASDESYRRIAQALGWHAEAFLEPRERLSFQEALLATTLWFSKHYVVPVRPLKTQPQIAELAARGDQFAGRQAEDIDLRDHRCLRYSSNRSGDCSVPRG